MVSAYPGGVPEGVPNHPNLRSNFAPLHAELDHATLETTGRWPEEVRGSFYRIGPNPAFPPRGGFYHWFAGDGMVHAFHIDGGNVAYRNRYLQTEKRRAEAAANRALINPFDPTNDDPSFADRTSNGVANTAMTWHHGALYALEEGHAPLAFDPLSLATLEVNDFGGAHGGPFSAHPHIDPATGNLVFFGYMADGVGSDTISCGEIAPDGRLIYQRKFRAPFAAMVHDMIVTREFIVVPVFPLTFSIERALNKQSAFAWEPEKNSWLAVLPRGSRSEEVRWIEADPAFVFHYMNAWDVPGESGKRIQADVLQFEAPPLFPFADGSLPARASAEASLHHWDLDLVSGQLRSEEIAPVRGEFPRIDESFACGPYRHGWFAGAVGEHPPGFSNNAVAHSDRLRGDVKTFSLPSTDLLGEPVFVPRANPSGEGDGYVLTLAWRGEEDISELLLLDALHVEDGPIATARLPHRVPHGFHALFRPWS